MRAGLLRHRITIQHRVTTTGAMGTKVATWQALIEKLPAEFLPLRGRELIAANQMQSELTAKFVIRYRTGITEKMRVLFDGEPYDIVGKPINVKGRRVYLELNCKAGVFDGKQL